MAGLKLDVCLYLLSEWKRGQTAEDAYQNFTSWYRDRQLDKRYVTILFASFESGRITNKTLKFWHASIDRAGMLICEWELDGNDLIYSKCGRFVLSSDGIFGRPVRVIDTFFRKKA
jgi:hypothetical protein